jgi:hypothetical protein
MAMKTKRLLKFALLFFFIFLAAGAFAQNGIQGINAATDEVRRYFDPGTRLMLAVGACLGIVGGVKVYSKWQQGDEHTTRHASAWFGSCIFLVVVGTILRAFFL